MINVYIKMYIHSFGGYLDLFLCDILIMPMYNGNITVIIAYMSIHFVYISFRE